MLRLHLAQSAGAAGNSASALRLLDSEPLLTPANEPTLEQLLSSDRGPSHRRPTGLLIECGSGATRKEHFQLTSDN